MKNQNDMIMLIVGFVITVIACVLFFTTGTRQVIPPAPPVAVVTTDAPLPEGRPVMAASLPQPANSSRGGTGLPGFGSGPGTGGPAGLGAPPMPGSGSSAGRKKPIMSAAGM